MLKRKVMEQLVLWKNKDNKKCVIISGARQVGKTYIVRAFAREQYQAYFELNFLENPELTHIFEGSLNADTILTGIRMYYPDVKIEVGQTLIFLDEIQECPNAVTALKFLAADQRIDVIASGSQLGMIYNRVTSYPVGSIEYIDMTALDFREFLWAVGIDDDMIELVRGYFTERREVPLAIHNQMMSYLRQYMVVGGMPEVVSTFLEERDYFAADQVQKRIYRDYLADIARYAEPAIKIKAENCYKSIPFQLSKENHKFQYSQVERKGNARKFETSIDWILNAYMAVAVPNVSYVEYPLEAHAIENNFRLYPSDIGLLIGMYDFSLKKAILNDNVDEIPSDLVLRTAKGGLYEALAADILIKSGHRKLFFYRNKAGTVELEFLLERPEGVIPVEIKAGRKGTKSLNNILKKDEIRWGYKLSSQNVGVVDKKVTMPLYMVMFI